MKGERNSEEGVEIKGGSRTPPEAKAGQHQRWERVINTFWRRRIEKTCKASTLRSDPKPGKREGKRLLWVTGIAGSKSLGSFHLSYH